MILAERYRLKDAMFGMIPHVVPHISISQLEIDCFALLPRVFNDLGLAYLDGKQE